MTDYGIDISHHQIDGRPAIDWDAVRGNNISFVYAKATEGTTYVDPTFKANTLGPVGAGIATGAYHFARPGDPAAQARFFASTANNAGVLGKGCFPPVLDLEDPGCDDGFIRGWIAEFRSVTAVHQVMVYANLHTWTTRLHPDSWADEHVWLIVARFNGDPGNPGWTHPRLAVHQHSNKGSVPGIHGNVDRDATVDPYSLADVIIADTT